MNKTILHIGLHKTASTFLQEHVWPNLNNYTYLTRPYTQHNHAFNQLQMADESVYVESFLRAELDKFANQNLLISDEALSGKPIFFSYLNRAVIARRLKALFPHATVIIFIRDQIDIMKSHYSTYVKMPYGTQQFEDFFWKSDKDYSWQDYQDGKQHPDMKSLYYNTNGYHIHLDCFKYSQMLKFYSSIFERVELFLYEELQNDPTDVVARISEIVDEPLILPERATSQRSNPSLSYTQLEKRRRANKIAAVTENRILRKMLLGIGQMAGSAKVRQDIDSAVSEMVGNYYVEDNAQLKELFPTMNWGQYPTKYV